MFYKIIVAAFLILLLTIIAVGLIFSRGVSNVRNGRNKSSSRQDRDEAG